MKEHGSIRLTVRQKNLIFPLLFGIGALCLALSFVVGRGSDESVSTDGSLDEYIAALETRLEKTLEAMGIGEVEVFITAENTFETVYASNAVLDESGDESKSTKSAEKKLAYTTDRESGEVPVVVKKLCPRLGGVLIVCERDIGESTRSEIVRAVGTALGLSQNKIYVTGGAYTS